MGDLSSNPDLNAGRPAEQELEKAKKIETIIGDYKSFFSGLLQQLAKVGIEIQGMPISHICYRVNGAEGYQKVRGQLSSVSKSYAEHPFADRPVSEFVLNHPLDLGQGYSAPVVELLPNKEGRTYPEGLENIGVLVGSMLAEFAQKLEELKGKYGDIVIGIKDRKPTLQIPYITFKDGHTVKFYDRSLVDIVLEDGFEFKSGT